MLMVIGKPRQNREKLLQQHLDLIEKTFYLYKQPLMELFHNKLNYPDVFQLEPKELARVMHKVGTLSIRLARCEALYNSVYKSLTCPKTIGALRKRLRTPEERLQSFSNFLHKSCALGVLIRCSLVRFQNVIDLSSLGLTYGEIELGKALLNAEFCLRPDGASTSDSSTQPQTSDDSSLDESLVDSEDLNLSMVNPDLLEMQDDISDVVTQLEVSDAFAHFRLQDVIDQFGPEDPRVQEWLNSSERGIVIVVEDENGVRHEVALRWPNRD